MNRLHYIPMSELSMMILCGVLRIFSGNILISEEWWSGDRYLMKVFSLSLIYSTLITILLIFLMNPLTLGMGLLFLDDKYTELVFLLYLIFCFLASFGIEWKNNQICLEGLYEYKRILQVTLMSHFMSLILMTIYVII